MREEFILPPPFSADAPFQLRLAGVSYCDGSYRIERETADFSVVEYIERGTGTLEIDGRQFHPAAGDLYFVPEGSPHRYWSDAKDPWVKLWMNFSGVLGMELRRIFRVEQVFLVRNFSRPELFPFPSRIRKIRPHTLPGCRAGCRFRVQSPDSQPRKTDKPYRHVVFNVPKTQRETS